MRAGYNQALREKKRHVGFLMILMQRLVTSSTRAIRTTLERRFEVLQEPDEQLLLFPELSDEEWADLDGQEEMDTLLTTRLAALRLLLDAPRGTEAAGPDAKAEALLDWIYRLQKEESDPDLKVLVFTEFVPTQEMLREFLADRGFSVVCLNGSLGMDERENAQQSFAGNARILVSTDAGGEGLNLQFCHVVVNYDIPWNPMKLEQRIGRVDRIGQAHAVRAVNFAIQQEPRLRGLATRIPPFTPGQPIPRLALKELPSEVRGFWSLWRITLHVPEGSRHRVMPLFRHEDGRVLAPTARFVWDRMLADQPSVHEHVEGDAAVEAFDRVQESAREHGQLIYEELVQAHRVRRAAEREKGDYSFAARRSIIERIGLPAVRDHRLTQIEAEQRSWRDRLDRAADTSPELVPFLLVHVEGRSGGG